jgi:hypothetical protein
MTKPQHTPIFNLPKKLHRYDEQLRGDDRSDPLLVDLSATLQKPYCDKMAEAIMHRWNCHDDLLDALLTSEAELENHTTVPGVSEHVLPCIRAAIAKAKGGAA